MNIIAEEILSFLTFNEEDEEDRLTHYGRSKLDGAPVGSGRYPLGSGSNPFQNADQWARYKDMEKRGVSQKEILEAFKLPSTTLLRAYSSVQKNEDRLRRVNYAMQLKDHGYGATEIARKMGLKNESSARSLLNEGSKFRSEQAVETAKYLMDLVDNNPIGMVEVGKGNEARLGISHERLQQALVICGLHNYPVYDRRIAQVTNKGNRTTMSILCKPGTPQKDVYGDISKIEPVGNKIVSDDNGKTFRPTFQFPASLDSKRLQIVYAEQGGKEQDGVIELRRGVPDISLGDRHYSQVRILVDGTHYLKGMAVYADDLPKGVDVRFNTNKHVGTPVFGDKKLSVLKPVKRNKDGTVDETNPFGSLIKEHGGQSTYKDKNGEVKLSLINKRADEGDWDDWSNKLPAQFLSKQNIKLIDQQLKLAITNKEAELEEIMGYTNNVVKKHLLDAYAKECDSNAVSLAAASLPRQAYKVILPLTTLRDDQVYAPNYEEGEKVALIRFPHASTTEIPILTVTHKNAEGIAKIGTSPMDAVGITAKAAERLSGADFDGDTVMVIPTRGNGRNLNVNISSRPQFDELKDWDPKDAYPGVEGCKLMQKGKMLQKEMGQISNLITDMTIRGAKDEELARALKHSMVIVDSEKHGLNFKKSESDNKIEELRRLYQINPTSKKGYGGAATLISRAKAETHILQTSGQPHINKETGELEWEYYDDKGKFVSKINPSFTQINVNTYKNPRKNVSDENIKVSQNLKDVIKRANELDDDELRRAIKLEIIKQYDGPKTREDGSRIELSVKISDNLIKGLKDGTITRENLAPSINYSVKTDQYRRKTSSQMADTKDALSLVSPYQSPVEIRYGNYANKLKSLANEARKTMVNIPTEKVDPLMRRLYKDVEEDLRHQIQLSDSARPLERQAQAIATANVNAKKKRDPELEGDSRMLKKVEQQEITKARILVGAQRYEIKISDRAWEAIQKHAISENTVSKVLERADSKRVHELAAPPKTNRVTETQYRRMLALRDNGFTTADIAEAMGLSESTVRNYLKGEMRKDLQ